MLLWHLEPRFLTLKFSSLIWPFIEDYQHSTTHSRVIKLMILKIVKYWAWRSINSENYEIINVISDSNAIIQITFSILKERTVNGTQIKKQINACELSSIEIENYFHMLLNFSVVLLWIRSGQEVEGPAEICTKQWNVQRSKYSMRFFGKRLTRHYVECMKSKTHEIQNSVYPNFSLFAL